MMSGGASRLNDSDEVDPNKKLQQTTSRGLKPTKKYQNSKK